MQSIEPEAEAAADDKKSFKKSSTSRHFLMNRQKQGADWKRQSHAAPEF